MTMAKLEVFRPIEILHTEQTQDAGTWHVYAENLRHLALDALRAENARLFSCGLAMPQVVAKLWLVNTQLTELGIAPRWRDAPTTSRQDGPETEMKYLPIVGMVRRLTDRAKLRQLLRWIDLSWLRHELGPGHSIQNLHWAYAFSAPDCGPIFATIITAKEGMHAKPNKIILDELGVPTTMHVALNGFQTQAVRDGLKNLERWLGGPIRALVEGQSSRRTHALSEDQVRDRLRDIRVIEMANGSPTMAAQIRRWMEGLTVDGKPPVSPPGMFKRRQTLAAQIAPLRRRKAWNSLRGD
jgi:hypothetical protein